MIVNKIANTLTSGLIVVLVMITRGVRAAALLALYQAEFDYWESHPKEWRDLADRWDGYQWNMVRHMVQECLWEDLAYHLAHNLKETHIRDQILQLLWTSSPRLCQSLGLDYKSASTPITPTNSDTEWHVEGAPDVAE